MLVVEVFSRVINWLTYHYLHLFFLVSRFVYTRITVQRYYVSYYCHWYRAHALFHSVSHFWTSASLAVLLERFHKYRKTIGWVEALAFKKYMKYKEKNKAFTGNLWWNHIFLQADCFLSVKVSFQKLTCHYYIPDINLYW